MALDRVLANKRIYPLRRWEREPVAGDCGITAARDTIRAHVNRKFSQRQLLDAIGWRVLQDINITDALISNWMVKGSERKNFEGVERVLRQRLADMCLHNSAKLIYGHRPSVRMYEYMAREFANGDASQGPCVDCVISTFEDSQVVNVDPSNVATYIWIRMPERIRAYDGMSTGTPRQEKGPRVRRERSHPNPRDV